MGADGVGTLPAPALGPDVIVVDLVYRSMTPLLASAERTGAASFSGLGLLVHQAALSFERWTERPAPLAVMADAARAASADQA